VVSNVVWATGYRSDYGWVDLDVFDPLGKPVHRRGVTAVPGLYFLGLSWQHTAGSALIGWVSRDAAFLANHISERGDGPRGHGERRS
jgi:putative flavoprotein involved in K+ transport